MARLDFKLPDIGEGVTEGEIVEWFVLAGESISEDDPMVEVMTDKATVTIGSPCDARVEELRFEVGEVAKVGQVILTLRPAGGSASSLPAASAVGQIEEELPGIRLYVETKPLATPATRRLAKEMGVDLRRVRPSGAGGRVTHDDVRRAAREQTSDDRPQAPLEERVPIAGVRRAIAERMRHAKSTAAHFTFVEECDATRLVEMRERLLEEGKRRGVKLTFLPFIVAAVTDALQRHPVLNSEVDEQRQELVYKRYYNIGVATATEAGLMVPVVRNAERLPLFELARKIEELSEAAQRGSLSRDDLRGSTFTITSLGKQSGLLATPILNHPEVGILGVHRIKEKPVVVDGEITVGKVMLLSLSFDHRIVDGHVGAAFAYDVIETLENPERSFYEYL
jgi:pyruvate dehydrogenase E2 component (dihydrolipoamide acetyltransferase)